MKENAGRTQDLEDGLCANCGHRRSKHLKSRGTRKSRSHPAWCGERIPYLEGSPFCGSSYGCGCVRYVERPNVAAALHEALNG